MTSPLGWSAPDARPRTTLQALMSAKNSPNDAAVAADGSIWFTDP
jgi:sugar lactone lactonase YvrE